MKIIRLPDSWAARIAAGEVVERPASVVKELIENSLDAGAREISVWIEAGGVSLIRISDDGEGISEEDLPLAVERHATSKIRDETDLWNIATLGFRGEALPSIGSVAKLEITSRPRNASIGYRIAVDGGHAGGIIGAGCAAGTTVEVRDLFFNIPARRKFLKSPGTELSHICDVVNHAALAHSDVHFRLHNQGKLLCEYPAGIGAADRLAQVFGRDIARGMTPFSWTSGELNIHGFLSTAPSSFPSTRYLTAYVNRRYVRDRVLTHAILHGYETLLMKGRYPAVVLQLAIPYKDVDVNVHPAKHEVRFRRQQEIHEVVSSAVKEGLRAKAKAPAAAAMHWADRPATLPIAVRDAAEPYVATALSPQSLTPAEIIRVETVPPLVNSGFFSSLEVFGQLLGCYLVCASARGLAVIDQHAAHERVAFERMRREVAEGALERQNLLIPQVIDLPPGEAALLQQRLDVLERVGFTVEPFGGSGEFVIRSAPALFPSGDYREAIRRMIAEISEIGASGELDANLEERLATIACHSVIRANRKLEREEIRALLHDLDQIDFATQCPHGRPVLIELSEGELEAMFRRT
jgi:DNA mismatch repair protein MutL